MKKYILLIAAVFCFAIGIHADNVSPEVRNNISIRYDGISFIRVEFAKPRAEKYQIKIYNTDFCMVHNTTMSDNKIGQFDIALLPNDSYIVQLIRDEQVIYTDVITKM